jgi:sigma-B regulation protein RsbU (phosphoserine phosphatase)
MLISSAIRDITQRKQMEQSIRDRESQLLAARRIQEHLQPAHPPEIVGLDIAGVSYPADYVAGDYFDYLTLPDGSLGIVIVDVSGHGFASALLAASTHALVRSLADHHTDVGEILSIANSVLQKETEEDRFITLMLGRLDPRGGSFDYASAGHQTGYIFDNSGELKVHLKSTALPLGIFADIDVPLGARISLQQADVVVLLTDGVSEAYSARGEMFGTQRALRVIRDNRGGTAREIIAALHQEIYKHSGSQRPHDDITTVVVKVD